VGGHQQGFARLQPRGDLALPVGLNPIKGGLEAFGVRQNRAGVAAVASEIELAVMAERRRRHVIGPAPDLHLLLPVLLGGFGLVEPGQAAIVTFVQPPVLDLWNEGLAGGGERQPAGPDGPGEN